MTKNDQNIKNYVDSGKIADFWSFFAIHLTFTIFRKRFIVHEEILLFCLSALVRYYYNFPQIPLQIYRSDTKGICEQTHPHPTALNLNRTIAPQIRLFHPAHQPSHSPSSRILTIPYTTRACARNNYTHMNCTAAARNSV